MLWGFQWSTPWGGNEAHFSYMEIADMGSGPRVRFRVLSSDYNQWVALQVDGEFQPTPIFAKSGRVNEISGIWNSPDANHLVSLVPLGQWPKIVNGVDLSHQQEYFAADRADRLFAKVTTAPALASYGVDSQLASWSLSGLKRFRNCRPYKGRPTWGQVDVAITNPSGSNYTVTLTHRGETIASGSRTGDGTITLAEANDSGVSGSVDITFSAADTGVLIARFPKSMEIHYQSSGAFIAGDFSGGRTPEALVYDDGYTNELKWRGPALANGTWYTVIKQVDAAGNISSGIQSGGAAVSLVAVPTAPGAPSYLSGDYSNTAIRFASPDAGYTYEVYDSGESGFLDIETASKTAGPASGNIDVTLDAISSGYTGKRYVAVRSVDGGILSGEVEILTIEYASGSVVTGRPPIPGVDQNWQTSGRTLTVWCSLNSTEQGAAAANLRVTLTPADGGSDETNDTAVSATAAGKVLRQQATITAGGDGFYYFKVQARTSGGVSSENTKTYGPVWLGTANMAEPGDIEVRAGM